MNQQGTEFEGAKLGSPKAAPPLIVHTTILKEIRSWAFTLLVLGVISLFASDLLSAPWGVMLIIVGLASFYFRSSAIMVVYAVTLAWAGISNITAGQPFWIAFAIFQWFCVIRVFQKFFSFRRYEANTLDEVPMSNKLTPKRSASIFPWAAGTLGVFSLLGLISVFVVAFILAIFVEVQAVTPFLIFIEDLVVNFGLLGFALGLASVLCKHPRKGLAIVGMITGILPLLVEIILKFVG